MKPEELKIANLIECYLARNCKDVVTDIPENGLQTECVNDEIRISFRVKYLSNESLGIGWQKTSFLIKREQLSDYEYILRLLYYSLVHSPLEDLLK